MSEQNANAFFFREAIIPALFVFFVIYGLPPVLEFLEFMAQLNTPQSTCIQPNHAAPDTDIASPPASVTGQLDSPDPPANFPPVTGDGGETG